MADHLMLQGGTWHVRLDIPKDVQKAFGGRKVLTKSLHTSKRSEAMTLRMPHLFKWKAEIAGARKGRVLPEGWQEDIVSGMPMLQQARRDMILRDAGEDIVGQASALEIPASALEHPDVQEFLTLLGLIKEIADPAQLPHLLTDLVKESIKDVYDKRYSLSTDEREELAEIVESPASYKPKSPITPRLLASFREFRERQKVSLRNIDMQESRLNKLSAYLTKNGKPLDFDSVSAWLITLNLNPKTLKQYLLAGSSFWKWAMKHEPSWRSTYKGQPNPFLDHDLPELTVKEKKEQERVPFEPCDYAKLFSAVESPTLAAVIDIAFHTGMRIEEICQLRTEHLVTAEGILCFDIADSKTTAGLRQIPVHPNLFETVRNLQLESEDGYLIKTNSDNKYDHRSDLLSKSFGKLKTKLGYDQKFTFHSIRHTVQTQLTRADVPGVLIAEILGHETGTVTFDVYGDGHSSKQKLDAIKLLQY